MLKLKDIFMGVVKEISYMSVLVAVLLIVSNIL